MRVPIYPTPSTTSSRAFDEVTPRDEDTGALPDDQPAIQKAKRESIHKDATFCGLVLNVWPILWQPMLIVLIFCVGGYIGELVQHHEGKNIIDENGVYHSNALIGLLKTLLFDNVIYIFPYPLAACVLLKEDSDSIWTAFTTKVPYKVVILGYLAATIPYSLHYLEVYSGGIALLLNTSTVFATLAVFFTRLSCEHHSNIGSSFLKAMLITGCAMFVLGQSGIISIIKETENEYLRTFCITVAFPFVREMGYIVLRVFVCRQLNFPNDNAQQVIVVGYLTSFAWTQRFLFVELEYKTVLLNVSLNGLQEILQRFTHKPRSLIFFRVCEIFKRQFPCFWNEKQDADYFDTKAYRTHLTNMLICEMTVEMVAIVGSVMVIILYHPLRQKYDFGYSKESDQLDYSVLAFSLSVQLLVEVAVDIACTVYELRVYRLPMWKQWKYRFSGYTLVYSSITLLVFLGVFLITFAAHLPECESMFICDYCFKNITSDQHRRVCIKHLIATNSSLLQGIDIHEYGYS